MHTESDLSIGLCRDLLLELLCERLVVEEQPGVIELFIERPLQISHALEHIVKFRVAHQ
jgi:hypothetical protein